MGSKTEQWDVRSGAGGGAVGFPGWSVTRVHLTADAAASTLTFEMLNGPGGVPINRNVVVPAGETRVLEPGGAFRGRIVTDANAALWIVEFLLPGNRELDT